jgi:hypothetical protein
MRILAEPLLLDGQAKDDFADRPFAKAAFCPQAMHILDQYLSPSGESGKHKGNRRVSIVIRGAQNLVDKALSMLIYSPPPPLLKLGRLIPSG